MIACYKKEIPHDLSQAQDLTAWHNDPISPKRADSMEELARMAGVTVGTVTSSISRRN